MSAGAGAGAGASVDAKIAEVHEAYAFLIGPCLECIAVNFGNKTQDMGLCLGYGNQCKTNCAFTSAGVSVLLRLLEMNAGIDIRSIRPLSTDKLPYKITIGGEERELTGQMFYMGVSNAIGLLWDMHDYSDFKDMGGPPTGVTPTGINLALNRGLGWFIPPAADGTLRLQEGINIVSFYDARVPVERTTTVHHSLVYKAGAQCILADSWVSDYPCDTPGGGTGVDSFERGFKVRPMDTAVIEAELNSLNVDTTPPAEKVRIMRETFLGPTKENYAKYYPSFKCVILDQRVIDEKLVEGFAARRFMFGGRNRKRRRTRRTRRKPVKRRRRTLRHKKSSAKRMTNIYTTYM